MLPPDTSLSEVRKAGLLRACMPPDYPPLVTGNRDAPGIDVELLQALAAKLGVNLVITSNPAMGQDFNPAQLAGDARAVRGPGRRRGGFAGHQIVPGNEPALRPDRLGAGRSEAARRLQAGASAC